MEVQKFAHPESVMKRKQEQDISVSPRYHHKLKKNKKQNNTKTLYFKKYVIVNFQNISEISNICVSNNLLSRIDLLLQDRFNF